MKILVAVKRVVDPYVTVRVNSDGSGVDTKNLKMAMNPFDEIALEEAIRLKEQGIASEVIVVSIGSTASQETLLHGLALGADRAILVHSDANFISLDIAKILAKIVHKEGVEIVLMGKQAIDSDNNQTPQMLAGLLDWPQATNVSKLRIVDKEAEAVREVDGGLETLQLVLPAVISADLRLNEPRYATLPNIMKAKRKPLDIIDVKEIDLSIKERCQVLSTKAPAPRESGIIVQNVAELVDKLKNVAKVL